MKFIEVAGKKLKLASRKARLYAFIIDLALIGVVSFLLGALLRFPYFLFEPLNNLFFILGLLFIDGFQKGRGIGKQLLSVQVLRLKDGEPCTYKDSFIRRLAGLILQPFDLLWLMGEKQQRIGDKLAETVVVKYEPQPEQMATKTEDPEDVLENVIAEMKNLFLQTGKKFVGKVDAKDEPQPEQSKPKTENPEEVLENAIAEMRNRLSEAREKVNASISIEKEFQDAYESAVAQAERWQERAILSLQAEREDLAREDIEKRNEYRRLADQYKKQWEEQKQIVQSFSNLLEHFQQKIMEAEGKKAAVMAQHRNVNAEAHLREMLKEIQDNKAFETFEKMEQDAMEATTLAKAAAEVDVDYQDVKLEREFAGYAEEASIDKDLAELKAKVQK